MQTEPPRADSRFKLPDSPNPAVPRIASAAAAGIALAAAAGGLLMVAPEVIRPFWPWSMALFSERFLGAYYVSVLALAGLFLVQRRWAPGWLGAMGAATFCSLALMAAILHFRSASSAVLVWTALHAAGLLIAGLAAWRARHRPSLGDMPVSAALGKIVPAAGSLAVGYAVALVLVPGLAAEFWPWDVDPRDGRLFGGAFASFGALLLLLSRRGTREEFGFAGAGLMVWGWGAVVGLFVTAVDTQQPPIGHAGAGLWLGAMVCFALLGALLVREAAYPHSVASLHTHDQTP